jgi:hypothetical protein
MTTKTEKMKKVEFTARERESLEIVNKICLDLMTAFGKENTLISPNTGEGISIDELPRIRGIISGLLDNRVWNIE